MSESRSTASYFTFPWLLMFIVIKVGGTALAGWSWWWILFPVVPDLVLVCRYFGWM